MLGVLMHIVLTVKHEVHDHEGSYDADSSLIPTRKHVRCRDDHAVLKTRTELLLCELCQRDARSDFNIDGRGVVLNELKDLDSLIQVCLPMLGSSNVSET